MDVVIDLTPSFCSLSVMRATLALGAHYVNTAACPEHLAQLIAGQPLDLAAEFTAAGRTALPSCGASPGVVNICCRYFCDQLDPVERIEIRAGFHVPAQKEMVKTWVPTWCSEQQYFDFCDPPCLFHHGKHEHMPCFYEPEDYDFGGNLGQVQLTHHAHERPGNHGGPIPKKGTRMKPEASSPPPNQSPRRLRRSLHTVCEARDYFAPRKPACFSVASPNGDQQH